MPRWSWSPMRRGSPRTRTARSSYATVWCGKRRRRHERERHTAARFLGPGPRHGDTFRGPRPPGVAELPGPGEMVVSPALKDLLDSAEGKLLRERLPFHRVGTIGASGLLGPGELVYYAGRASFPDGSTYPVTGFGQDLETDP